MLPFLLISSPSLIIYISLSFQDDATGKSRGYAFVTMEDSESGRAAMKGVTGTILEGREVRVEISNGEGKKFPPPFRGGGGGGGGRGWDRDRGDDRGGYRGGGGGRYDDRDDRRR